MRKLTNQPQKYYFSERLKRRLGQISRYPLTIVEAPSGFGKTTAIREFLKENLPEGASEYWYTCLGESASTAWLGICELFSNISGETAEDLRSLKMPTMDTLFRMASCLRELRCGAQTYLIIDNYQLVDCDIPRELISVFSMHGNPNLRMIFITQQVKLEHQFSILNNNIYTIDSSAFFFDKEGTANLFRLEGIHLSSEETDRIYRSTEGWVSAIRLQIISCKETGHPDHTADIAHLVETAIWNRLGPQEQDFLFCVSVLESFTPRQAAIMLDVETLPEPIACLLKTSEFIRYIPDQHRYHIHSILRDYLLGRLTHEQPEEYQRRILRKAGHAYAAIGQLCPAAHAYYRVRDFDAILSLPFTLDYFQKHPEAYRPEFPELLLRQCPEETLCRHPLALLVLGHQAYSRGQTEAYREFLRLLQLTLQRELGFSPETLRKIRGETLFLASLADFNDLEKFSQSQKTAWETLGTASEIRTDSALWGFGTVSVLALFWRESGKLEDTLSRMDEMDLTFRKMTRGYGAGSRSLFRAEALLSRGEDQEAEVFCHKALYEARSFRQTGLCLCAELVLARIAILRGDVQGYFTALKNIADEAQRDADPAVSRLAELCMSAVSLILGIRDHVAPWLSDAESLRKNLQAPVVPLVRVLRLQLLLMDRQYNEFYGQCQLALEEAESESSCLKYIMPQVCLNLDMAAALRGGGKAAQAQRHLRRALELALPDQVYLPFAQVECMAEFLPELTAGALDSGRCAALLALCKRQRRGVELIRKAVCQDKSPLTLREREIAALARDRLSAREIAQQLFISEMTVRATLRSVYSKLDIHSKSELSAKEF